MITQGIVNIGVQELIPGMIISQVIIRNGTVLLKEGSIVNDDIIDSLQNIYLVDKLQVYVPAGVIGENKKEVEMKKVEQAFEEVADKLKEMSVKMDSLDESSLEDLREFAWKIESQFRDSDIVLSSILFKGDGGDHIYKHGVNVAVLSALLGKWLGMDDENIKHLIYAALLHDFGITKLSRNLQIEPDLLSDKKNEGVKEHVKIAYECIKSIKNIDQSVIYGVLVHHERCDGSGYPLRKSGDKIHPFAKIIAIADEFDVLNSDREIMDKKGAFYILQVIKDKSLKNLDYKYAKVFLEHIFNFYIGEKVRLSSGVIGKVLQIDMEDIEHPLLFTGEEFIDMRKNKDIYIRQLVI